MPKYISCICLVLCTRFGSAQQKEICFTIDDLPVVSYGNRDPFYLWDITLNLVSKFDKNNIPAIGFVNEGKMYKKGVLDSTQLDLLKMWFQNGYEIGNHTLNHTSYHKSSFEAFTIKIMEGEKISRHLEQEYNKELSYFRHPYLHIGQTKERYDSLNAFLVTKNYTVAPVTVDNNDWQFAKAYSIAERKKDKSIMDKLGEAYLKYTVDKLKAAERMSLELFGRNIKHTMLLHANKLNADYMNELAKLFTAEGYQFISLSEALNDEAYQTEIKRFDQYGRTWLERWADNQDKLKAYYADSPKLPEWIKNIE